MKLMNHDTVHYSTVTNDLLVFSSFSKIQSEILEICNENSDEIF